MKQLIANREMEYAGRSLKIGDVFKAVSDIDEKLLTLSPTGSLSMRPAASIVEETHGTEKTAEKISGRRNSLTSEDAEDKKENDALDGKEAVNENSHEDNDENSLGSSVAVNQEEDEPQTKKTRVNRPHGRSRSREADEVTRTRRSRGRRVNPNNQYERPGE